MMPLVYSIEENIHYDAGREEKFNIQIKARKSDSTSET